MDEIHVTPTEAGCLFSGSETERKAGADEPLERGITGIIHFHEVGEVAAIVAMRPLRQRAVLLPGHGLKKIFTGAPPPRRDEFRRVAVYAARRKLVLALQGGAKSHKVSAVKAVHIPRRKHLRHAGQDKSVVLHTFPAVPGILQE